MYSQADIEDAVAAGALAPEQAVNLREFVAWRNGAPPADEEPARIILGFNDWFVASACLCTLGALMMLGLMIPGHPSGLPVPVLPIMILGLLMAAGAWGLSELFLRGRRYALAGIVLPFALGLGALLAALGLSLLAVVPSRGSGGIGVLFMMTAGAVVAAVLCWLHWRRFRAPFAVFVYSALAVLSVMMLIVTVTGGAGVIPSVLYLLLLIGGLAVFGYAMSWDLSDVARATDRAETGMWLHWLAAMLLTGGLMGLLGGTVLRGPVQAVAAVLLFLPFAAVSLAVNRRALLLSGTSLLSAGLSWLLSGGDYARWMDAGAYSQRPFYGGGNVLPSFAQFYPGGTAMIATAAFTLAIIAALLILFTVYWQPLRRGMLKVVPTGLRERLTATALPAPASLQVPPPPPPVTPDPPALD
jgi:hypothetical protein